MTLHINADLNRFIPGNQRLETGRNAAFQFHPNNQKKSKNYEP